MGNTVDAIIEAAIRRGELDNLPGKGKPLVLRDESGIHVEDRMTFHVLNNAGMAPPEVAMMKRLNAMRKERAGIKDPEEHRNLGIRIAELESVLQVKLERARRR